MSRGLVQLVLTAAALAAALLVVLVALVWWRQERIVFQPPPPPHEDGGQTTRVAYRAADGQPLFAYLVGDPRQAPGVLGHSGGSGRQGARRRRGVRPRRQTISHRAGPRTTGALREMRKAYGPGSAFRARLDCSAT